MRQAEVLVLIGVNSIAACNTFDSPPDRQSPPPQAAPTPRPPAPPPPPAVTSGPCGTRVDLDGDGFEVTLISGCAPGTTPRVDQASEDCDDTDPTRHVNELQYIDADGDGFGDGHGTITWACAGATLVGFVANGKDCNDDSPGEFAALYTQDGDGFGNAPTPTCGAPGDGWAAVGGDCADADPNRHPGATPEVAWDDVDVDCDGFDIPHFPTPALGESVIWNTEPVCSGSAFAVIGIERITTLVGGVILHIANVGSVESSGVVLVVSQIAGATHPFELPSLTPGQVTQSERIPAGIYRATFNYDEATSHDAGIGELDEKDAGANTANSQRCALSRLPLDFSSSMPHL